MRLTVIAFIVTLLAVVPASGQAPAPAPPQHPYGLDPYNPSDAALLREYGVTLVAQTPLVELRKLDPYKPSHAALLRQLGGGIPLWGWAWYASPGPAPLTPFQDAGVISQPAAKVRGRESPAAVVPPPASSIATLRKPESNDGVWIRYAEQRWISAGKTVPFDDSEFVLVGQYGDFPVYRRARAKEDVIYVPMRKGLVMPYRLKP
jgi:hypothetical protein